MRLDALLIGIGRSHLRGWKGYPRDETFDGQPRHPVDTCYKCAVLAADDETRAQIWALRPIAQAAAEPDEDKPQLATLMLEPGELQLLMALLRSEFENLLGNRALTQSEEVKALLKQRATMAMSLHTAVAEAFYSVAPNFTCPRCGTTSHNPTDVLERWCDTCHQHADDLDSVEETAAILADPEAMATLRESEAEIDAGEAVPFDDYLRDVRSESEPRLEGQP